MLTGLAASGTLTLFSSNFGLAAADLNRDGNVDLVASADNTGVRVLLGNGDATFTRLGQFETGVGARDVVIADLNQDDVSDLAVTNRADDDVSVLLGIGDGTFQEADNYALGHRPGDLEVADVDVDGNLDLVAALHGCSGSPCGPSSVVVLLGNGDGSYQDAVEYDTHREASGVDIGDIDGDGDLEISTR